MDSDLKSEGRLKSTDYCLLNNNSDWINIKTKFDASILNGNKQFLIGFLGFICKKAYAHVIENLPVVHMDHIQLSKEELCNIKHSNHVTRVCSYKVLISHQET